MQQSPTLEDDRTLIQACQAGNLLAAERLVVRYQDVAVRVAFLLTSDSSRAVQLAGNAFLDLFAEIRHSEPDREVQPWLLAKLVDRFLAPDPADSPSAEGMLPVSSAASRFTVETDRTRTRAALMRLEARSRAALVLAEYSLLPVPELAAIIDDDRESIPATLDSAGQRLSVSLDLDSERTVRKVLAEAAFDTPRVDLWPEIGDDAERGFQQELSRSRLINLAVGGSVVGVLLVAGLLIFGDIFSGSNGTVSQPEQTSAGERDQRETAVPAEIVPVTSPDLEPTSDVADVLLLTHYNGNIPETLIVQSAEGTASMLLLPGDDGEIRQATVLLVTPDGEQVVMLYYGFEGDTVTGYLAAFDGQLATLNWRTPIVAASHAASPDEKPAFLMSAAVDDRRIYVAVQFWNEQRAVEIMIFERETGQQVQHITTNMVGFSSHDVRIFSPPGDDTVYLFTITQDQPPQHGMLGMVFLAYEVPSGRQVHGKALTDLLDSRIFFIYNSRYTPDGGYLYGLLYTVDRQEFAVHFFNLPDGTVEPAVPIPFQPASVPLPVQQAVSHDGRLLYVLSPLTREIAVVDLDQRRLQSIVPLDMGVLAQQPVDQVFFPDSPMQLSPDGRWLYAIGVTSGGDPARRSGVWVINTASMSVAGHWFPGAEPVELLLAGDGRSLYVRDDRAIDPDGRPGVYWVLNTETGFVQFQLPLEQLNSSLSSLAALYSNVFGTSPAIDGALPVDAPISAPLAGMQVFVDGQDLDLGDRTVIEVQFVNPLTGVAVEPDGTGVRYQEPSAVQAVFATGDGGGDIILELGPAGFGRYRGVVTLPATGDWSVNVVARWAETPLDDLRRFLPDAITVNGQIASIGAHISGFSNNFRTR